MQLLAPGSVKTNQASNEGYIQSTVLRVPTESQLELEYVAVSLTFAASVHPITSSQRSPLLLV